MFIIEILLGGRIMYARRFMISAAVYAFLGMAMGIYMAASRDHIQMPTHAHLNLLGWVSMGLFALAYRSWSALETTKFAAIHYWLSHVSVIGLTVGVGLIYAGKLAYEPIATASSIIAILNMALFIWLLVGNAKD
jgi:hypothetical protein